MTPQLTALEARVIGCLIEKQITTPEQYPLSVNALVLACNQKSNRDPVLELSEQQVQALIDGLIRKHLIIEKSGFGSRVPKYQQRFCNTEFSPLQFTMQQRAIVCELLLRGPQTPGELRSRAHRMAPFADAAEVESALTQLGEHEGGALVLRLTREPGRREARYAQLFTGAVQSAEAPLASEASPASAGAEAAPEPALATLAERVTQLEANLAQLRTELAALRRSLGS